MDYDKHIAQLEATIAALREEKIQLKAQLESLSKQLHDQIEKERT